MTFDEWIESIELEHDTNADLEHTTPGLMHASLEHRAALKAAFEAGNLSGRGWPRKAEQIK